VASVFLPTGTVRGRLARRARASSEQPSTSASTGGFSPHGRHGRARERDRSFTNHGLKPQSLGSKRTTRGSPRRERGGRVWGPDGRGQKDLGRLTNVDERARRHDSSVMNRNSLARDRVERACRRDASWKIRDEPISRPEPVLTAPVRLPRRRDGRARRGPFSLHRRDGRGHDLLLRRWISRSFGSRRAVSASSPLLLARDSRPRARGPPMLL
jgi:hypothetical protein